MVRRVEVELGPGETGVSDGAGRAGGDRRPVAVPIDGVVISPAIERPESLPPAGSSTPTTRGSPRASCWSARSRPPGGVPAAKPIGYWDDEVARSSCPTTWAGSTPTSRRSCGSSPGWSRPRASICRRRSSTTASSPAGPLVRRTSPARKSIASPRTGSSAAPCATSAPAAAAMAHLVGGGHRHHGQRTVAAGMAVLGGRPGDGRGRRGGRHVRHDRSVRLPRRGALDGRPARCGGRCSGAPSGRWTIPIVLSVLWGRQWRAGVFIGVALALMLHVTVALGIVYSVFASLDAVGEVVRPPQGRREQIVRALKWARWRSADARHRAARDVGLLSRPCWRFLHPGR